MDLDYNYVNEFKNADLSYYVVDNEDKHKDTCLCQNRKKKKWI